MIKSFFIIFSLLISINFLFCEEKNTVITEPQEKTKIELIENEDYSDSEKDDYAYLEEGIDLHFKGDIRGAISKYKECIKIKPSNALCHYQLAEAYRFLASMMRNKEFLKICKEEFKIAIKIDPDLSNAYTSLGVIYEEEGLILEAIDLHRKAIKKDSSSYKAYNNLAHAYLQLGLHEAAIQNYQKAIKIQSDFSPAYHNLGVAYLSLKKFDEALENFKLAVYYSENNDNYKFDLPLYYNDLGALYAILGDYENARINFEKGLALDPNNPALLQHLKFLEEM